jgi:hypothetical protein
VLDPAEAIAKLVGDYVKKCTIGYNTARLTQLAGFCSALDVFASRAKNDEHEKYLAAAGYSCCLHNLIRTYAVGVLSLRQSGTLLFNVCGFEMQNNATA